MDALGCDLGNHTMNHCALDKVSKSKRKYEINGVNELVKKAVGYNPKFLRPPYGSGIRDAKVQKAAKMPIVCWSVDTLDWKTKSKKETVKSIMNSAKDGQIILMHDIHSWSVDAAIEAIPKLQKKGYQIVSVSEMAEAKGVKLKKGQPYFEFE
jgi:peptidoglycan/xylan/chitin deacetylase (PgdA/CDA1 family)